MVDVKWIGSPNFYPQNGVAKTFSTDHWMVGTLASTDSVFNQTVRKASATYGVGQTEIHQYVNEKDYPFSDGNTFANQHTISVEHEGGYVSRATGQLVVPSPAVIRLSGELLAGISDRHGWGKLEWMVNVFPHKHWVATACPGSLDTASIIAIANQALGLGGVVTAGVDGGTHAPLGWNASAWPTYQLQAALIKLNYNLGPSGADGDYGAYTTAAVHQFEIDQHLTVDVGIAGTEVTGRLAQLIGVAPPAVKTPAPGPVAPPYPLPRGYYFGPEGGPVQSVSGYHGHRDDLRVWQQRMKDRGWGITVDGLYGFAGDKYPRGNTASIAGRFQAEKGLKRDNLIGPETWTDAWTLPIT